ncbi:UvrD-helicase domain-containing protein [Micromonospora tulbaghiae]|uniref:UvrD-helicase domain-containing protein n=1 Tax=Micromonospora tulbaghiae TaxID=479978 RepID=UPI0033DF8089
MTAARSQAPDTEADIEIRRVLDADPAQSFSVIAGAGSGKTTSLVKALAHVAASRGKQLRTRTQQVACITYTEIAAGEIFREVGSNPLVHVSTIHSFLWKVIAPFQKDIGIWVNDYIECRIKELKDKVKTSNKRNSASAQSKLEKRLRQLEGAKVIKKWTYGVGADYTRGVIGHADVIAMVPSLLRSKTLLARVVANRFPFIFVDESQDTDPKVLAALLHVHQLNPERICLGLFGDPMQRIHFGSSGDLPSTHGWKTIQKPENFRSSLKVLEVINHIRAGADGLHQVSGLPDGQKIAGEAFFFTLSSESNRNKNLQLVRQWLDRHSASGPWSSDPPEGAKILLIMHKLAARRLGFENLYHAFHQQGAGPIGDSFDEGSAWPLTALTDDILPLCAGSLRDVPAAAVRRSGTALSDDLLKRVPVARAIQESREALRELRSVVLGGGQGSIERALRIAYDARLVTLDPRLAAFLDPANDNGVTLSESTKLVLESLMACDIRELEGYIAYINRSSPYSTQHGTKGAEFSRVIVVLDDNEERWHLYSYEKLLGLRPLSATDRANASAGKETVLERTRKLLYVCASRAIESLAIVLYSGMPVEAADLLVKSGYATANEVVTQDELQRNNLCTDSNRI